MASTPQKINYTLHESGILGQSTIENNINICRLKNGHTAIGLRRGDETIVYELDDVGRKHVISLLSKIEG